MLIWCLYQPRPMIYPLRGMSSIAADAELCLFGVAICSAHVFSFCFVLHLFVPWNVRRAADVLKLPNLPAVGGDPKVPGLLDHLEAKSFGVWRGLRVHVGLVDNYVLAAFSRGIMFPSCCGRCVHPKSAADYIPEAKKFVCMYVNCSSSAPDPSVMEDLVKSFSFDEVKNAASPQNFAPSFAIRLVIRPPSSSLEESYSHWNTNLSLSPLLQPRTIRRERSPRRRFASPSRAPRLTSSKEVSPFK